MSETNKTTEYYKNKESEVKITLHEPIQQEPDQLDFIENQLVILSKQTIDQFLKYNNASDLIGLYTFYYYTAKWQNTNQPKCTDGYCMKGLRWGKDRFYKAKKVLKDIGLIQTVKRIDKLGKVIGWYVKINYIWSTNKANIVQSTCNQRVDSPEGGKQDTNALSVSTINALSVNKEMLEQVVSVYPTKCHKRGATTRRSTYDKDKLKKKIREIGVNSCVEIIKLYVADCVKTKTYIMNFKTFVNNFPAKEDYKDTAVGGIDWNNINY